MILPRTILLWYAAVLLPGLGLAAAAWPAMAAILYAAAALVLLVPMLDAALSAGVLEGVKLSCAPLVRLTRGAAGKLDLCLENASRAACTVRLGFPLPAELGAKEDDFEFGLPQGAEHSAVTIDCLPTTRGQWRIEKAYLGATSRLGFWIIRKTVPLESVVRVYPNLAGERKKLSAMFLNRAGLGLHAQRQVGQGREFEKLRDYVPGDSYGDIHWKATARRIGQHKGPATKVYQIERTQEVYVLVDSSRLSGRMLDCEMRNANCEGKEGSDRENSQSAIHNSQLERYIQAALVLGIAAQRQGDHFGVISFSDRVENFVRAGSGRGHYRLCRDGLYALQPKAVTPDFAELFTFLRLRLRRRALLVFLTSLDDPILAESFAASLPLISRQHLVLAAMIPPPSVRPLFSGPEATGSDDIYSALGGHMQWHKLVEFATTLRRSGVGLHLLENETFVAQLVSQYMGIKRRQLI